MTSEFEFRNTDDDALPAELLAQLGELVAGLGGTLIRVEQGDLGDLGATLARALGAPVLGDQERPDGLAEGQQMGLVVRPDTTSERVVYADLESLTAVWAQHLGAQTERVGSGVVALEVDRGVTMWARTWEPDEYDLDTLDPNITAGFIWWMSNDQHHLPIFGPVLLTGEANPHGVHGLGATDLAVLERIARTEREHATDEQLNRDELAKRFREGARDGLMFQDAQAIQENSLLGAPPSVN